jgi:hypothetical protein
MLGDKVFGLLIAHHNGLPVPRSTVINRRVAPFSFGHPTGSAEVWLRTSPREQEPGRFTTTKGWVDPFALLAREDPEGNHIASVICQAGIPAEYSGAAIVSADGRLVIEGKRGQGEQLMKGEMAPEQLPPSVQGDIGTLFQRAERLFGKVRFEWVHDGNMAWIVQLHRGQTVTHGGIIVPGEPARWVIFDVARGLSELRRLLEQFEPGSGLLLRGRIGLTSHIADVLRRSNIPARIEQDLR